MASWTVSDLFTDEEIAKAGELHADSQSGQFATRCAEEIVEPALPRINAKTGQENDAKYLAYALEHALNSASTPRM